MRNQTSDLWISSVCRELNQYSRGHGFKSCTGQKFFYTLFSLLVNSVNYYENRFHFYFFNCSSCIWFPYIHGHWQNKIVVKKQGFSFSFLPLPRKFTIWTQCFSLWPEVWKVGCLLKVQQTKKIKEILSAPCKIFTSSWLLLCLERTEWWLVTVRAVFIPYICNTLPASTSAVFDFHFFIS